MEPWGPLCRCGNRGCLETLATTTAIARGVGTDLPWPALLALARDGDAPTLDAVREAGTLVGQVLAGLCTAVDPGIVVVGGDLGGCPAFLDAARAAMWSGALRPEGLDLVAGVLGDRAELLGALDIALDATLGAPVSTSQHLRAWNAQTLVDALRHHGRMSRSQLTRATGFREPPWRRSSTTSLAAA